MVSALTGKLFVFPIPWKNLLALKTAAEIKPSTRLRAVIPFPPVGDFEEEGSHEKVVDQVEHDRSEKQGNQKEVGSWKEKGGCEKQRSRKEKESNKGQRRSSV